MKSLLLFCFVCFLFLPGFCQLSQNIRGKITDKDSKSPLIGANIRVFMDSVYISGATSNEAGEFMVMNVPVGRISVIVSYIGYGQFILPNIEINSAKELILNIEMEETLNKMNEVTITAHDKIKTNNEMATVSGRLFSIEEAGRYAGSRGEIARMASNFAGVQGSDDSRNDIIVRGNSPMGVLWRIEGIDIPNPNHFASTGSTGGPVSILNANMVANSDFFTGAFPAEYGNANSAVFDVRFKNGNNEHHEFAAQFGVLGAELTAEGPLTKKKKSSYIFAYRYSTLKLFQALHIPIGTSAIPAYQDLSFKMNFPLKKNANITVFGVSGISKIDIVLSNIVKESQELYGGYNYDQYTNYGMAVIGASYAKTINTSAYTKIILSASYNFNNNKYDFIYRQPDFSVDSVVFNGYNNYREKRASMHWFITKKLSSGITVKAGLIMNVYHMNYIDSARDDSTRLFNIYYNADHSFMLAQPYIQTKIKLSPTLSLSAGINLLYSNINRNSLALNPRAGLRWDFARAMALSFGYGWHSQTIPWYIYFGQKQLPDKHYILQNRDLGMYSSQHFVLAYDWSVSKNFRFKAETYYQYLFHIPVSEIPSSSCILNSGLSSDYIIAGAMKNTGIAHNYGLELTFEKFYSNDYFYMTTFSLYQSKYEGSDGNWYNTNFNGNYVWNVLGGKEFKIQSKNIFGLAPKVTYAGGERYGPVDTALTAKYNEIVQVDDKRNTLQFAPYFRFDLRLYYKINFKKITHEIAIDIVNVFNTKNVYSLSYGPDPNKPNAYTINKVYQLGLLPLFYYKVDF